MIKQKERKKERKNAQEKIKYHVLCCFTTTKKKRD